MTLCSLLDSHPWELDKPASDVPSSMSRMLEGTHDGSVREKTRTHDDRRTLSLPPPKPSM